MEDGGLLARHRMSVRCAFFDPSWFFGIVWFMCRSKAEMITDWWERETEWNGYRHPRFDSNQIHFFYRFVCLFVVFYHLKCGRRTGWSAIDGLRAINNDDIDHMVFEKRDEMKWWAIKRREGWSILWRSERAKQAAEGNIFPSNLFRIFEGDPNLILRIWFDGVSLGELGIVSKPLNYNYNGGYDKVIYKMLMQLWIIHKSSTSAFYVEFDGNRLMQAATPFLVYRFGNDFFRSLEIQPNQSEARCLH